MLTHGTNDKAFPFEPVKESYKLDNWVDSPNIKFYEIENMKHAISDGVVGVCKDFMADLCK